MGIQRFPNLLRGTVLACRLPYPGGPKGADNCFFPFGISLHLVVTGSATTLDVSRLAEFTPSLLCAHGTARELASPPFEDVYIRACTNPGHPESASNMTTWVNSQFPRPDFHRQVQWQYGLQNDSRPLIGPARIIRKTAKEDLAGRKPPCHLAAPGRPALT